MYAPTTLAFMPRTRTTRPTGEGRAIKARRAYLGKTGEDIETETNGVIYKKLLSRIETGKKSLSSLRLAEYETLLRALEWSQEEFVEQTGSSLPIPHSEVYNPSLKVPILGTVSAGVRNVEIGEANDFLYIDPGLVRGRQNLAVLRVNGDSMASENTAKDIPEGSMVVFEYGAVPLPGDTVIAWVEEYEIAVIKLFEEHPTAVLKSHNPRGPIFRAGDVTMDVRGVVRLVIKKL